MSGGEPELLRWAGLALSGGGLFVLALLALLDEHGLLRRAWAEHVAALERESRFLRLGVPGARMGGYQLGALGASLIAAVAIAEPLWLALGLVAVVAPRVVLARMHERRVVAIEAQIDGWLLVLANGLRAAPSLGEAIRTSVPLIDAPLAEELDVVLKELRLGTPLDRAILELGERVRSRVLQSALAALLVGRQTGGELSAILEETSASIREMTRLEGVLRAKTAEGRSQAYVLGAVPFFLILAIHAIDPHWLDPLTTTTAGAVVTAASTGLWLAAILLARRILAVDL